MLRSSPNPIPVDLSKILRVKPYAKLQRALVGKRMARWNQEGRFSPAEFKLINQHLERGHPLAVEALSTHPHGKTAQEGGMNLDVWFKLTETFQPEFRVKLHPDKKNFLGSQNLTAFLSTSLRDTAYQGTFVEPCYVDKGERLTAFEIAGKTLDQHIQEDPERLVDSLDAALQCYFGIERNLAAIPPISAAPRLRLRKNPFSSQKELPDQNLHFTRQVIQPYDKKLEQDASKALQIAFQEIGDYLNSLEKILCLDDFHHENVLINGHGTLRLIDQTANQAPLAYGLTKLLSHARLSEKQEEELLQKAKGYSEGIPGSEELEKVYYFFQIHRELLGMQRALERRKFNPDYYKNQSLVRYNLALQKIARARQRGYLESDLDEKLKAFCTHQGFDLRELGPEELSRLKLEYYQADRSTVREPLTSTTSEDSGNPDEEARRFNRNLWTPVRQARKRFAAMIGAGFLAAGLIVGGMKYLDYHRSYETRKLVAEKEVAYLRVQAIQSYSETNTTLIHNPQREEEITITPAFLREITKDSQHVTPSMAEHLIFMHRLLINGGYSLEKKDEVLFPNIQLMSVDQSYKYGTDLPCDWSIPKGLTPRENARQAVHKLDELIGSSNGNYCEGLVKYYWPGLPCFGFAGFMAGVDNPAYSVQYMVYLATHKPRSSIAPEKDFFFLINPDELPENWCEPHPWYLDKREPWVPIFVSTNSSAEAGRD